MPDLSMPPWLRSWASTLMASSVFGAFGVSVGGLLGLVALMKGVSPWSWFTLGACIPPGIMALIYTTDFMFERRLRNLKRWKEEGVITEELYDAQLRMAMEWRASRLYGIASKPAGRSKTKRGSKKAESSELGGGEGSSQAPVEQAK